MYDNLTDETTPKVATVKRENGNITHYIQVNATVVDYYMNQLGGLTVKLSNGETIVL